MSEPGSAYRTDIEEMKRLVDRASQIEGRIEQHLDQIERRVADLHVQWKGTAASAHLDAHRRWLAAARDMQHALGDMGAATDKAHSLYSGVVNHHRGMWPSA